MSSHFLFEPKIIEEGGGDGVGELHIYNLEFTDLFY